MLFFSMRRNGKSLGQMVREEIGVVGGVAALIAVFAIMIIILAVLALVVVNALAESPWGVFSISLTIPIALFMGFYLRSIRPGRVAEVTVIGVGLLLLAIIGGGYVEQMGLADALTLSPEQLTLGLVLYGFIASILPVWMLLTPRDYLSTFMKVGVIVLLAVGLLFAAPTLENQAVTDFAIEGTGPVFAGKLFPFVFITIACGALSGFHSLIASGTTPKMVAKESQVRMIGYGAMLMESFVAISALIAASVIDQGLYFAMNSPAGATGGEPGAAAEFVGTLGFSISPADLTAAAQSVEEETLISRTGGAPTLAFGMSSIFTAAFGGGLAAFWYHFAIMFEALFILTAVDAGTRVGRFMLQDTIGNVWPRYADLAWKPASWSASAIVVGLWGYMLYVGVTDPLGGINQLFPLFGISNQLLAAIALTLCVTLLIKHGKAKWAWVPGVGLVWDLIITMTASYQKVFSDNPKIGYFTQRSTFQDAIDNGEVLAPATDRDQMETDRHELDRQRDAAGAVRAAGDRGRRERAGHLGQGAACRRAARPPRCPRSRPTWSPRRTSSPPRRRRRPCGSGRPARTAWPAPGASDDRPLGPCRTGRALVRPRRPPARRSGTSTSIAVEQMASTPCPA